MPDSVLRWVSCSREVNATVAEHSHGLMPGTTTTLCGCTGSHPDVWRNSARKPRCPKCLDVAADRGL